MSKILVVSPGVLPVPPVLGGAVENLIARLQGRLADKYEFHYISVAAPKSRSMSDPRFRDATVHVVDGINPLEDFHAGNNFELKESEKWDGYKEFCIDVVGRIRPDIIHIHNEALLALDLRRVAPQASIICHINDEVVTRLNPRDLLSLATSIDLLLSCSAYIAGQVNHCFRVNSVRAPHHELFYNFVDLNEFSPETVSSSEIARLRNDLKLDGAPVVLFAGRMIEQKGPHLALRALRWARRHGFAAKLLCVGASWYSRNNPTAWIEYLRREAEELNDDVVFTGYIDHSTMPAIYALADIAVAPSIWDDPSPFVVYEAQAMRRPIVGSMRGGIPEIIDDRTTGRCIDVFNTPLFGQIIASLLSDEGERSRLGANGRLRVAERFSLDGAVDQMDQIYQRLLSRHSVA